MSYILDALKKAEAERNREAVPGIHTQPVFVTNHAAPASLSRKPWLWACTAVAALGVGALVWFKPWEPSPQAGMRHATDAQTAAPAPAIPEPSPVPPLAAAPAEPARPMAEPPRPVAEADEAPEKPQKPPAPAKRKAAPAKEPDSGKAAAPASETTPAPTSRAKPASKASEEKAAPAPAEPKVMALHELPDNIRREIPPLAISGYLYSGNKADRTVLINQKLLHEGDRVAPDLLLERLTPSGLVLNYKGYRYRMSY